MQRNTAQNLLNKTKEDYCQISSQFSATRQWIWPELLRYLSLAKKGESVLDFGCGNGRLWEFFKGKQIKYTGIDFCENFIKIAKEKYSGDKARFIVDDVLNSSLTENSFDKIFSIAVLHHIPSRQFQQQYFKEISRLLKKDGIVVITVWNLYQRRYFSFLVKFTINRLFGKLREADFDFGDVLVPWKEGQKNPVQRYVHAFRKNELKRLAKKSGLQVKECKYSMRNNKKTNLILVAQK